MKFCYVLKNSYVPFDIFWKGKIDSSTLKFGILKREKARENSREKETKKKKKMMMMIGNSKERERERDESGVDRVREKERI